MAAIAAAVLPWAATLAHHAALTVGTALAQKAVSAALKNLSGSDDGGGAAAESAPPLEATEEGAKAAVEAARASMRIRDLAEPLMTSGIAAAAGARDVASANFRAAMDIGASVAARTTALRAYVDEEVAKGHRRSDVVAWAQAVFDAMGGAASAARDGEGAGGRGGAREERGQVRLALQRMLYKKGLEFGPGRPLATSCQWVSLPDGAHSPGDEYISAGGRDALRVLSFPDPADTDRLWCYDVEDLAAYVTAHVRASVSGPPVPVSPSPAPEAPSPAKTPSRSPRAASPRRRASPRPTSPPRAKASPRSASRPRSPRPRSPRLAGGGWLPSWLGGAAASADGGEERAPDDAGDGFSLLAFATAQDTGGLVPHPLAGRPFMGAVDRVRDVFPKYMSHLEVLRTARWHASYRVLMRLVDSGQLTKADVAAIEANSDALLPTAEAVAGMGTIRWLGRKLYDGALATDFGWLSFGEWATSWLSRTLMLYCVTSLVRGLVCMLLRVALLAGQIRSAPDDVVTSFVERSADPTAVDALKSDPAVMKTAAKQVLDVAMAAWLDRSGPGDASSTRELVAQAVTSDIAATMLGDLVMSAVRFLSSLVADPEKGSLAAIVSGVGSWLSGFGFSFVGDLMKDAASAGSFLWALSPATAGGGLAAAVAGATGVGEKAIEYASAGAFFLECWQRVKHVVAMLLRTVPNASAALLGDFGSVSSLLVALSPRALCRLIPQSRAPRLRAACEGAMERLSAFLMLGQVVGMMASVFADLYALWWVYAHADRVRELGGEAAVQEISGVLGPFRSRCLVSAGEEAGFGKDAAKIAARGSPYAELSQCVPLLTGAVTKAKWQADMFKTLGVSSDTDPRYTREYARCAQMEAGIDSVYRRGDGKIATLETWARHGGVAPHREGESEEARRNINATYARALGSIQRRATGVAGLVTSLAPFLAAAATGAGAGGSGVTGGR